MKPSLTLENQKEILTLRETMKLLGLSRSTIYRRIRSGTFPAYRLSGKIYFKHSDIIDKLEQGKIEVINSELQVQDVA